MAGRRGRLAAGLALAASLAGCASAPSELLLPVPAAPGNATVEMLAATTRAPSEDAGILFSGERGAGVAFTDIAVSIPPGREVGTVQWPNSVPGNPETDFVVTSVKPLAAQNLLGWFKTTSGRKRRVFVFVHGFNTPFGRAVFRLAQIAHDADADAAPVLFSWPSRGRILDYKRDLDNATYSRSDLANLLQVASESSSVSEIVILAHSMGAWLTVEALKQIALERGGVPRRITNLVLASPDLDVGVFRRQIEDMGPRRPQVTLFVSQADRALQLSRIVARGGTRLGAVDLSRDEYMQQLGDLAGLTVLDLTALRSGDRINHDLYAQSPAVVRLIGDRLIQGQIITDSDVSPALAAAEAVGSAAGFIVASPILVLDAATAR